VLRFHERRFARRDDLIAEARRILTAAGPEHNSLVVMVADPVASYADFLEGLSADADWATQARQLVTTATTPENHGYTPSLANPPQTPERRPGGVALTTGMDRHNRFEGRDRAAEVVFYESGRLALVSERPTFIWSFSNVNPPPPDQKVVLEELIVGNVDLIVRLAVEDCHQYGYRGAWRFAVVVSGLHGASSPKLLDRWGDERGPTYTDDSYSRSTEQTLTDLDAGPDQTTSRLVMPLLRALGVHEHDKWARLRP
jgi:hypothetical protein